MSKRIMAMMVFALGLSAIVFTGCGDDEKNTGEDLVTVSGHVVNIDDLTDAQGVIVTLLDTGYASTVVSGTDGAFVMRVPRGSELVLFTDDPAGGASDDWFPFINVEMPQPVANDNVQGLVIHACPNSSGGTEGSVAIWDDYLANKDAANGDLFVPTSSATSGGLVSVLFTGCAAPGGEDQWFNIEDISVSIDAPEFPVQYLDLDYTFAIGNVVQSEPIVDPALTATDGAGWVLSVGDPSFSGDSVTLTISDDDAIRNLSFSSPVEIPVRPGTISLVWGIVIDGMENSSVNELVDCAFGK